MTSSTVRGYLVWLTCLSVPRSHCRLCRTRGCRHPPTDTVLIPGILWHQTPLREVQEKDQTTRTRKWPIDKELAKLALNATLIPLLQEGMYVVSHVLWGLICKCNVSCLGWGPTSPLPPRRRILSPRKFLPTGSSGLSCFLFALCVFLRLSSKARRPCPHSHISARARNYFMI